MVLLLSRRVQSPPETPAPARLPAERRVLQMQVGTRASARSCQGRSIGASRTGRSGGTYLRGCMVYPPIRNLQRSPCKSLGALADSFRCELGVCGSPWRRNILSLHTTPHTLRPEPFRSEPRSAILRRTTPHHTVPNHTGPAPCRPLRPTPLHTTPHPAGLASIGFRF